MRSRDITRAWQRAGIPPEIWRQRPDHAFRRGFKTGMLALKGHPNAIDFLQGHSLGPQSSRASYIDPWRALPLVEVAALVPKIGEVKAEASKGGVGEPPQLATAQSPLKGAGDEG